MNSDYLWFVAGDGLIVYAYHGDDCIYFEGNLKRKAMRFYRIENFPINRRKYNPQKDKFKSLGEILSKL